MSYVFFWELRGNFVGISWELFGDCLVLCLGTLKGFKDSRNLAGIVWGFGENSLSEFKDRRNGFR